MSERLKIVILSGDKKITRVMQSLDVFEQSKVIAEEWVMTFAKKQNFEVKKCIDGIRAALESEMNQNVAAMFVVGYEDSAYVNEKVQLVSDGKNWFLLRDWLKAYGVQASV